MREITEYTGPLRVDGNLDLSNTQITSLPDGLTVGGWLDLRNTQITSLPDGLTVGGGLDLRNTQITSLPEGLTVGGGLDLSNTQIQIPTHYHSLKDGDYVPGRYIYADGILTHIKSAKKLNQYMLYIGKIPGRNVVSDGMHYAHCDSLRSGIQDLLFKSAKDRGAEQYRDYTLDTVLSVEDAAVMYRVITGACRQGTQQFIDSFGAALKESYTIRELLAETKGQYGHDAFAAFFEK